MLTSRQSDTKSNTEKPQREKDPKKRKLWESGNKKWLLPVLRAAAAYGWQLKTQQRN